jgi:hypothetical protein
MPIKTYVTTSPVESVSSIKTEEGEILTTLGTPEEAVAIQLQELFGSVTEAITASLEVESQLAIEITGSISLKVQGGAKYLFFNAGAEASTTGTMKVTFSTTLKPKAEISLSKSSDKGI